MKSPSQFLREAAETFDSRNAAYGNNYLDLGNILAGLFPDGLTLKTPDEWLRIHIFMLQAIKMSRYAHNFTKNGHADSMRDLAVYAAMMEAIDELVAERQDKAHLESLEKQNGLGYNLKYESAAPLEPLGHICAGGLYWEKKCSACGAEKLESCRHYAHPELPPTQGLTCDCSIGMCTHRSDCRQQAVLVEETPHPRFSQCQSCDHIEICMQEQHCDRTGNGYR